jgi:hypothetical protein
MAAVPYVRKDVNADSKGTKGVARDAVVAEIRKALLDNGVIASTTQVVGRFIENAQKSSSGTPLVIYVGTYATSFINVDAPVEVLVVQHEAQGNDYGDKAPGKAATYAEKLNLVKGLLLETGISEEGRNPGEGDETEETAPAPATAIKTPQRKSAEKANPDALPPAKTVSEGLVKQISDLAEKTGQGERLAAYLKKVNRSTDELTEAQAKAVLRALTLSQNEREPGQEG